MTETPIGRLKVALIAHLVDAIENGATVVDQEGEVRQLTCPANILAVAAKVVKDFHVEVGTDPSVGQLDELVKRYQLRKSSTLKETAIQ